MSEKKENGKNGNGKNGKKGRKKKEHKILRRVLLTIPVILVVLVNVACFKFDSMMTQFFSNPAQADAQAVGEANRHAEELTKEIEAEGIVLLKNENETLPLSEKNVNVFGWGSVSPIYAGTGSGSGNNAENVTPSQGLENAGFTVNGELTTFYEDLEFERKNAGPLTGFQADMHLYEAEVSDYSEELIQNAVAFSDIALVVISRPGGEASDLLTDMAAADGDEGRHMLELTRKEEDLLAMLKENFEHVVILVNAANPMELGFLEEEGIDAALWIGDPGKTGFESVGRVLCGDVNPSGALVDTYAYDATSSPAYANCGNFEYSNGDGVYYVEYAEGIYVGYRYYETRYVDNETGLCDEEAYRAAVQFPFGYGLSYTEFSQSITDFEADGATVKLDVTVTNTGDVAGKDIVQVYYTAPYTVGGIEKSFVVLGAYGKTGELAPGESETVSLEMAVEDMASYDYVNQKAYVLEAGTYEVKLMDNAHDLIDSRSFEVEETVVYDEANARDTDLIAATNVFDDAAGEITYLSRADWEGTFPKEVPREKEADAFILEQVANLGYEVNEADEDIVIADHGLTLKDMAGLSYDDEKWDDLLEQLSVSDMQKLIGLGGYQTMGLESIDKGLTLELDGPAGVNSIVNGEAGVTHATEVVLASSWNNDLAYKMGESLARSLEAYGIDGIYAPAANIHRTPFSGRNFEYYSEDAYLSAKMVAAEVSAIRDNGKYCMVKHFALNDQETNRNGILTWANEQAIREIYLKPFEYAVKEGNATGMMSAFNRLGTTWCGASQSLLTTVLRGEWGFEGAVITDYDGLTYMNPDQAIRAGNDLMLSNMEDLPSDTSNTGKQAMRRASHNILYMVANSDAVERTYETYIPSWAVTLVVFDAVLAALIVLRIVLKKKKGAKRDENV